jgi:hypothetical protein
LVTDAVLSGPDLNKIAETLRRNQASGNTIPSQPDEQIFIDDNGDILLGSQVAGASTQRLSRVTQETFYLTEQERYAQEKAFVDSHMPSNTVRTSDGSTAGWAYAIKNEWGDSYTLFVWFEASSGTYIVSLVSPELAGVVGIHDCHLYADGRLCLKKEGGPGYRSMSDAYARSAIWTRGASSYRRGNGFQFNIDQLG